MKIRPIKTRKDYEQALQEVEKLMTAIRQGKESAAA